MLGESLPPFEPPTLARSHVLMSLIDVAGGIRIGQVRSVAEMLHGDALRGIHRSLAMVCAESGTFDQGQIGRIARDPCLAHVALGYGQTEMEIDFSPLVTDLDDPPSEVDTFAGSGASRPLIIDLYAAENNASLIIQGRTGEEEFEITYRGRAHADAIRAIFGRFNWRTSANQLVII